MSLRADGKCKWVNEPKITTKKNYFLVISNTDFAFNISAWICKRMKLVSCIYVHLLCVVVNPLRTGLATLLMGSLANSQDPDEIP